MEVLREAPKSHTFIPLSEHQSATPASFYAGPTVLHYHSSRCKVLILEQDLSQSPALSALVREAQPGPTTAEPVTNGDGSYAEDGDAEPQRVLDDVDVWVTSDKLFLYSGKASVGLSIPYPSISLHAIQTLPEPSSGEQQGVYMQLIAPASGAAEEDEELESVSLTIVPPTPSQVPAGAQPLNEAERQTPASALFSALSNCSNLHPDAIEQDEADLQHSTLFQAGMIAPGSATGGLPAPVPGSGGWITAENMSEYFDEDGNWIGDEGGDEEQLGPGAGTVRSRGGDPEPGGDDGEDDGEDDSTKWQRTS